MMYSEDKIDIQPTIQLYTRTFQKNKPFSAKTVFEVPTTTGIVERKVMKNICASFELLSLALQRYIRRCEDQIRSQKRGEREEADAERRREENSKHPYRV